MKRKILSIILLSSMIISSVIPTFAEETWSITYTQEEDKYNGPGVNITKDYFNDTTVSRVYNETLNGIQGDAIHNSNVLVGVGPTYQENTQDYPIFLDNNKPSDNKNVMYAHYKDDNGPGKNMTTTQFYEEVKFYDPNQTLQHNTTNNQAPTTSNIIYAP